MLTHYIQAAMNQASYEILEDGTYYGEIRTLPGVFANADSLEICRTQLQEVLEGWILLGLQLGHPLPEINGINLEMGKEADLVLVTESPQPVVTNSTSTKVATSTKRHSWCARA